MGSGDGEEEEERGMAEESSLPRSYFSSSLVRFRRLPCKGRNEMEEEEKKEEEEEPDTTGRRSERDSRK